MSKIRNIVFALSALPIILFSFGCNEAYTPKPRGFQRIDFPEKAYKKASTACPFEMEIPVYSELYTDSSGFSEKCWYNLYYQPFNATLHLSYKPVSDRKNLFKMIEDSRTLVYKHTIKADEIYETVISNKYLSGMIYNLSGNTATNFQFYVTDSANHFLRGSLYFNVKTNNDSIAPVLLFLENDIIRMIESLRWSDHSNRSVNFQNL